MDKGSQSFDLIPVTQSVVTAPGYGYSESLRLQGFLGIGVEKNTQINYQHQKRKKKIQLFIFIVVSPWLKLQLY